MQTQLMTHTHREWLRLFDREDIQFIILDLHADADLVTAIRSQPGWLVDFEDDETVIFTLGGNNYEPTSLGYRKMHRLRSLC